MDIETEQLEVRNNTAKSQYEVQYDGQTAVLSYFVVEGIITMVHTGVPKPLEGHGIAARLVEHALEDARAHGLRVVPRCPYVARYVREHPEYDDIIVER